MKFQRSLLVIFFVFLTSYIFAQDWNQIIKATASDRDREDHFGYSVSISGDYAIVGARLHNVMVDGVSRNAGVAYIFEKDQTGLWIETNKLMASDSSESLAFGQSVSISGNHAIIGGSSSTDVNGGNLLDDAGAAYVFERDGLGNWLEVNKLVASDRGALNYFGQSVSISGDYAIIGARENDSDVTGGGFMIDAGAAYVFERNELGAWVEVNKLVASDRGTNDEFGWSVSISGDYSIVGAFLDDEDETGTDTITNSGSAYVFERDELGDWSEVSKLVASDRYWHASFGNSVSISGDYIVVGAVGEAEDSTGGNTWVGAGAAYVFEKNTSGDWLEVSKLISSDRNFNDYFGQSVSISGNYIVVGAYLENDDAIGENELYGAGSAYVFERDEVGNWFQVSKIVASDRALGDRFAGTVSISGESIIVGTELETEDALGGNTLEEAGSIYIYERTEITGLTDQNAIELLELYPNPSSGLLSVNYSGNIKGEVELLVYALSGELVLEKKKSLSQEFATLDVSDFKSGNYILKIISSKETIITSFIKL